MRAGIKIQGLRIGDKIVAAGGWINTKRMGLLVKYITITITKVLKIKKCVFEDVQLEKKLEQ